MNCREAKRRLENPAGESHAAVREHLEGCAGCAALAERLDEVRGALRRRHAGVSPDSRFATRVAANVEATPSDLVGWAALRLLPGALMLVLVLSWLVVRAAEPGAGTVAEPLPSEDLLNWVVSQSPESP